MRRKASNVYLPLPTDLLTTYTHLPTHPTHTESALSQMKSQEVFYGNHCCRNILH